MNISLNQVIVVDPSSPFNNKKVNIVIENSEVKEIKESTVKPTSENQLYISPSWVDVGVNYRDPGSEWHENLSSLAKVAAAGGYRHVVGFPNTLPVVQNKESLAYFSSFKDETKVKFYNFAALSKNTSGEDFTEWNDLHVHGALGFSDGIHAVQNGDLCLKALQYFHSLGSVWVHKPMDKYLSMYGQMHEGLQSTLLGLKGIPDAAESLMVQRDLNLLKYTGLKSEKPLIHFSGIHASESIDLIRKAKKEGLPVSCDTSAYQLIFTDTDLADFDTNLKVWPPFSTKENQKAILTGLKDGTIDIIQADHSPWDAEHKELEFDLASFGAIGLQTCFSVLNSKLDLDLIIEKIAINPRKIFGLPPVSIEVGKIADFTLFDPALTYNFTSEENRSSSSNTALMNTELTGKALKLIN